MDTELLVNRFALMGARAQIRDAFQDRRRWERPGIDIGVDGEGEFFDIRLGLGERVEYEVVDVRPDTRHLLLLGRREGNKEKYLCGHDERHWFVCAVPGASVSGVVGAMESLQPQLVRSAVSVGVKRHKTRLSRRNEAFVRQGEWFFVPAPRLVAHEWLVRRNEPLSRGSGSKAHMCQFAYRTGGTSVWVCRQYPSGVGDAERARLIATQPNARRWNWQRMTRDPALYVKGRVSHSDHKTVVLDGWHRVAMNTEWQAPFAHNVSFLD
jgi:hypothetical protein